MYKNNFSGDKHNKENLTPEEFAQFNKPAIKLLANVAYRSQIQSDISVEMAKNIDILSIASIIEQIKKTLEIIEEIAQYVKNIEGNINHLKNIEKKTLGSYGYVLETKIPQLERRLEIIKDLIESTYKKSNTHRKLSKNEINIIEEKRKKIYTELHKFTEDLREYLP